MVNDEEHIPIAPFIVGDDRAMIYEYMEGNSWVGDEFPDALSHIETCINAHWDSEELIDKRVRAFFETLKERCFESSKVSHISWCKEKEIKVII